MIVSDERIARFIAAGLGENFIPPYTVMGIERDGKIVAGILFNVFEGADVHVTAYGKGWTKEFLSLAGHYAYKTLECERVTFQTEIPSVAVLAQKLGGQIEGVKRNHFGYGRDATIIGVLRSEYRYGKFR